MWSLGSIIGAAMGGFLAQPARYYPDIFPPDGLFGKFPYLLPNLVAAVVILLAIIQGLVFLKETNPRLHPSRQEEDGEDTENAISTDERSPLLQPQPRHPSQRRISATEGLSTGRRRPSFIAGGGTPTTSDPSFDIRRSSMSTIHSIHIIPSQEPAPHQSQNQNLSSDTPSTPFNGGVITITIALTLMCYHQMGFGALLPIYLLDSSSKSGFEFFGGLGYTVHAVGIFMSVNGVIALLIQAFIFPLFVSTLGVWHSFLLFTIIYPISYIIIPFLSTLPAGIPTSAGIYVALTIQNFFAIIYYPCALILLKNAAPGRRVLGRVNGLAMSACSGARTVAPPLVGIVYSWAGSAFAWWSCAVVAVVAIGELWFIPREMVESEGVVSVENGLVGGKMESEMGVEAVREEGEAEVE